MKILTITIHNVPNFGSVLQTLATQMLFEREGCSIETIDYCPPRLRLKNRLKAVFFSKVSLVKKLATFVSMDICNAYVFSSFLKRWVHRTRRVYDLNGISKLLPKPDLYLTGSDQVWNTDHNQFLNTNYYYENVAGKKASLASSFGRESLPDGERDRIKALLEDYSFISVREVSAKDLVKKLLPHKVVEQILDPTLLITAEEWRKIATHSKDVLERYVLIYPMSGIDYRLFDVARTVADTIGAKSVRILSPGLKTYKQCDQTLKFQSPERFLELIDHAACVVTNSFHGTVFSINFETPFISIMPEKFSTRLESILNLLNLKCRVWNEKFNYQSVLNIDFSEARNILQQERDKAQKIITSLALL